jgi:single-stranded-DNA-specific exonuclease
MTRQTCQKWVFCLAKSTFLVYNSAIDRIRFRSTLLPRGIILGYHNKRWKLAPLVSEAMLDEFVGDLPLSSLLAQVLFNRGITTTEEARKFLDGDTLESTPFKLKGMNEAVSRIRRAIRVKEPIVIYGDFDVDGITATAVLTETLESLGARVRPYIPNRFSEGYGLHKDALSSLAADGIKLVVTVDCGIRSPVEVAHSRDVGMDIIVTDHHSIGPDLPAAVAVINPKQADCPYGFQSLAGVGVAFKLAQALLMVNRRVPLLGEVDLSEETLLDLVALGTVADMVPLEAENRDLVKRGLPVLQAMGRPGIRALIELAGIRPERIGSATIGYVLGPRLNAAGRLHDAMKSYELLTCRDGEQAAVLAQELDETNRERQRQTQQALDLARRQILVEEDGAPLLIAAHEDFPQGIVGLVAGRLTEEFYRPSIVIELGEEYCRASARSIAEFNITDALDICSDLLVRYGGHAAAAGFTVEKKNLPALLARLRDVAREQLTGKELLPSLDVDVEVPLRVMDWETLGQIGQWEPFGVGNPYPVFLSTQLTVRNPRTVGNEGQHLKLNLYDGQTAREAIGFGMGAMLGDVPASSSVDAVYCLECNEWNGDERLQLKLEDIRPSQV